MPVVDQDQVIIHQTSREGTNNINIEWEWIDGRTGVGSGKMMSSWATADEARIMAEEGNQDDILRTILSACINKNTGAFRPIVFDALGGGKQYIVKSNITKV